jgi:cell division protein FtsN
MPSAQVVETPATPPARPAQPKFEFYNLLPEMEVVLSESEVKEATAKSHPAPSKPAAEAAAKAKAEPAPAPTTPPAAEPPGGEAYLVQIGSFRRTDEAERLKAQLAMQGIQAQIQQVTINGKDTYYRVRTPALRGNQLNEVRGRLKKSGMEGTVIKLKG